MGLSKTVEFAKIDPMFFLRITLGVLCSASLVLGADPDLEREYEQVRKIALRDAKVRAAFDAAEKKLEAKILEIDPELKRYLESRRIAQEPTQTTKRETPKTGWFSIFRSKSKTESATPPRVGGFQPVESGPELKHEVVPGDTLSSIAVRYQTSVEEIQKANGLKDPRKLRVGQVLLVPGVRELGETDKREWDRLWDETVRH